MEDKTNRFSTTAGQNIVRQELYMVMRDNLLSMARVAELCKVSLPTLIRFLQREQDVQFDILLKIDHFIMKNEK